MSDRQQVERSSWHGLYREGWGSRLRPASYAHPAKNSYGLSVRIYVHALEEGWIKPGDYLIDIFAGIGGFALEAMRHGLNFVGCELEMRFCDMGQGCDCTGISKADWVQFYGRWDRMRYEGGRHWCPECLMKAGTVTNEREFKPLPLPGTKWAAIAKTRQATLFDATPTASYVRNSGKIPCTGAHRYHGNIEMWERQGMAGTAVIVQGDSRRLGEVLERARICVSSPPYAAGCSSQRNLLSPGFAEWRKMQGRDNDAPGAAGLKIGYGNSDGQLAAMPDTGFEAALSAPVYVGQLDNPARQADYTGTGGPLHPIAPKKPANATGTPQATQGQPEEASSVPEVRPVLAVSSPAWMGSDMRKGGSDLLRDHMVKTGRNPDMPGAASLLGQSPYGTEPGQLAQMPEGDLVAVISSPPYIDSISDRRDDPEGNMRAYTTKLGPPKAIATYSSDNAGQLAALPEGDHAKACERPVCCISSPPFQGITGNRPANPKFYEHPTQANAHVYPDTITAGQDSYGSADGQLGAMPTGDHAQALEAEAETETGRAQACISSPPWEVTNACEDPSYREDRMTLGGPLYGGYSSAPGQLGQETGTTFWAASRQILEEVYKVLPPGGHCIFVCKRFVRAKKIVEFPTQWARLCEAVGFKWIHHHKAWLVEDRGAQHTLEGGLERRVVKRFSFFRRIHSRNFPELEISYEDVLCFVKR